MLVDGVAERLARGDRVEGAGAVDDPVRERDAAELDQTSRSSPGRRRRGGRSRPWWGRRSRSRRRSRRPCRTPWRAGRGRRARCRWRRRRRASAAGRRRRPRRAGRSRARRVSSVGDEAAIVGDDAGARDQRGALGVGGVAEAEQREGGAPSVSPQMASGAMPTPPPTRIGRRPSRGRVKPLPSGPRMQQLVAGAELGEPVGAGADVLEQEVELAVAASHHARTPAAGTGARPRPRPIARPP